MASYYNLTQSYAFIRVPVSGRNDKNFGFMHLVDPSDDATIRKIQQRAKKVDKLVQRQRTWIDQFVKEPTSRPHIGKRLKDTLRDWWVGAQRRRDMVLGNHVRIDRGEMD